MTFIAAALLPPQLKNESAFESTNLLRTAIRLGRGPQDSYQWLDWRYPLNILKSLLPLTAALTSAAVSAAPRSYPPISEYLSAEASEIELAASAAPANISGDASIEVLTSRGYKLIKEGTNGFHCLVLRGFTAPTYTPAPFRDLVYNPKIRAPICFNKLASKEVLPYYKLRADLAMKGLAPDEIQTGIEAAYKSGGIPKRTAVSFAYMWSSHQYLAPEVGHWHPHMMVFAPFADNSDLGGNAFTSPHPQASDDANTPFAVLVIPVGDENFVSTKGMSKPTAHREHVPGK